MSDIRELLQPLKSRTALILTAAFAAQAILVYGMSKGEAVPLAHALTALPQQFGEWHMTEETPTEPDVLRVLKADDTVNRNYANGVQSVNLFVAYFKSQRTGQAPHSPRNCLPGSGWMPLNDAFVKVPVDGYAEPITINRYTVQKGDSRSVVMYWYQSHARAIASEYWAKFYAVADAVRYNRTDTALIRVVVPVTGSVEESANAGMEFIRKSFDQIRQHLGQ